MKKILRNRYFILICLVLMINLIAFSSVIINNHSVFVLYGDSVEQQYAFLTGFWQKVHDLDFNKFEWSNGFGANSLSYVFYNLFSPFNWLVLLLKKEMIYTSILYINMFKMVVLSVFSLLWLSKLTKVKEYAIIGSLIITFSGWSLFYYQYNFVDAFVFYPLILYSVECYLQDKTKIKVILFLFLLTVINYYESLFAQCW